MAFLQCSFFAPSLMRTTDITVILPTDKLVLGRPDVEAPRRFPTLYLLHGIFGSCHDWLHGTRVAAWAQNRGIAVVMPSGENRFYVDGICPGEQYGKFIGEDLVTFTRRSFPLSDKRGETFIGGLSMGGYGAMRNGLYYAGTFGAIVSLSGAFILDRALQSTYEGPIMENRHFYETVFGDLDKLKGGDNDPRALVRRRLESGLPMPRLFLACGTEDTNILPYNEQFHAFLEENGVEHTYITAPGAHNWVFWDTWIEKALAWLLPGGIVPGVSSGHISRDA